MSEPKKLFLLTGAGFSCGFLKYKEDHLTTQLLTSVVLDKNIMRTFYLDIKAADLLPHYWDNECEDFLLEVPEFCNNIKNSIEKNFYNPKPNYEHLVYALEIITEHKQRTEEYLKQHYNGFVGEEWQLRSTIFSLASDTSITRKHIYVLKDFILSLVCLFMNEINANNPGLKLINKFVTKLYQKQETDAPFMKVSHYTLNYDNLYQLSNPDWQKRRYNVSYLGINQEDWPVNYLHGSVLFTMSQLSNLWAEMTYKEALEKTEHSEIFSPRSEDYFAHRMITGLGKERKLLDFPYDHIYNKMILDFHSSSELWVIGYSFSDPHINSILRQGFPRIKKMIIVDKADNANNHISRLIGKLLFHQNLTFYRNESTSLDPIEGTYGLHNKVNLKVSEGKLKSIDAVSNDGFELEWHLEGTEQFMKDYLKS